MPEGAVLEEGTKINNRFRVINFIGGGAMARVYRVEHIELGTIHAIKEQQGEGENEVAQENSIKMALGEARILSKLSHPNIPKVTDSFREGNKVYFVMDYIEGQNLKSIIDRTGGKPIDIPSVLRWGIEVCDVLVYLHSQTPPIIFRDIKPSNLIRRPNGTVCLVDFGIARRVRQGAATDTVVFGSPGYAPPEQYGQGQTDPRADIYALGATLHHLLTGRDPSAAPFKWPPVRSLNPEVPKALENLVMKCLLMEVSQRPESADRVLKSLQQCLLLVEKGTGSIEMDSLLSSGLFTQEQSNAAASIVQQNRDQSGNTSSGHTGPSYTAAPLNSATRQETQQSEPSGDNVARPRLLTGSLSPLNQFMFMLLFISAVPVITFGVALPVVQSSLAPSTKGAKDKPTPAEGQSESDPEYQQALTAYYQQPAIRAKEAYDKLAPIQYLLDILSCALFFFGILRPMKPTRSGLILTICGVFTLICLTGALFLPSRGAMFGGLAVAEALLFIPCALLLNEVKE